MYLNNCKIEAHVTGDMALLGHEVELHNYSLELLASQLDTQLTIPEELKQKYGQRKIKNKFVQNAEENWNAKQKVFYIVMKSCRSTPCFTVLCEQLAKISSSLMLPYHNPTCCLKRGLKFC